MGSELVRGIQDKLGVDIPITGGLAGDNAQFIETYTDLNGTIANNQIVALGVYGDDVVIGFGSRGRLATFWSRAKSDPCRRQYSI